jgi:hypothetical protein
MNTISYTDMSEQDVLNCAQAGNAEAQFEIGVRKISSATSSKEEVAAGLRWLERSAVRNHLEAQLALAYLLLQGKSVPQNRSEGIRWATEAVANGSEEAAALLRQFWESAPQDTNEKAKGNTGGQRRSGRGAKPAFSQAMQTLARNAGFEFNLAGNPKSDIDFQLLKRGVQRGLECRRAAITRLEDHRFIRKNPSLAGATPEDLGEIIAGNRGYLDVGSESGMAGIVDGADADFDQLRSSFILGVREGLSGITPDECVEYYSHSAKR